MKHSLKLEYNSRRYNFSDGSILDMTEKQLTNMFESIHAGKPNSADNFFLEKLRKGIVDESGLAYLIEAENIMNNPEAMADLWAEVKM